MPTTWRRLVLAGSVSISTLAMAAPASAQAPHPDRLFVRGYGGVTFGTAAGSDRVDGVLAGGGFGIDLSRHFAVIGDVGYVTNLARQDGDEALRHIVSLITLVSGVDAEVTLEARTLSLLGGARYTFRAPDVGLRPFVEGQGGMVRSSYRLKIKDASGTLVSDANSIFKDLIGDTSVTAPAAGAGAGVGIQISNSLWAEAAYHYLRLFGDAKANVHMVSGGVKVTF